MERVQLARRLNLKPPSVVDIEKSEAAGTIQLGTLRRAAEALDCQLVYVLVPNSSLEGAVKARARKIAVRELARVARTMALEDQETDDEDGEARIDAYIREQLRDRDLWNEP